MKIIAIEQIPGHWAAVDDDSYEPGSPIGLGRTATEAILDLLEILADKLPEIGEIFDMAEELAADNDRYCTKCGQKLDPKTAVWLELDQRDNTYHSRGDVPENLSQGWFPFGSACARRESNTRDVPAADNDRAERRK